VKVPVAALNLVWTSTEVPISVGNISYAATVPVALTFPARLLAEEQFGYLLIGETYSGGGIAQIIRIELPYEVKMK
jgi:hypothetical protein